MQLTLYAIVVLGGYLVGYFDCLRNLESEEE
jgi:hypothetical protein